MSAVNGILGRIATIEARFAPPPPIDGQVAGAPPAPTDFDPFGAAYQAAVDQTRQSVPVDAAQFASAFPGATTGSVSPSSIGTYEEIAAAVAGVAAPVGPQRVGGYGQMPVPQDLARFGNGRIPSEALYPIGQGGHRLYAPAAASWRNLVSAAAADGVRLRITDSYRSFDQQVDLVERKGLYSEGGLGATPGTSNHGWGLAVDADVTDPATQRWLQANGPRFGWVEAVTREPWHWEFRPGQV